MIDQKRLQAKAKTYGIDLDEKIVKKFYEYSKILLQWNEKSNLTAIVQGEEMENKHFIDSLVLASQPEVQGRVADVGTGPGFPGIILKLYCPNIELILIESNKKKNAFLMELAKRLEMDVKLCDERAEDLGRSDFRETFDLVTARAVSALPTLAEYCIPLVKPGGWFIPMKGKIEEELEAGKNAIGSLGGNFTEERTYTLPDGSERRLYLIEKVRKTEGKYPRNTARIKKNPL